MSAGGPDCFMGHLCPVLPPGGQNGHHFPQLRAVMRKAATTNISFPGMGMVRTVLFAIRVY